MRKLAAALLLGVVGCAPVVERAEAQAVVSPNPQGNQQTLTPACVAPASSGGNVDVSVPSGDCIDVSSASNTCGAACPANVSVKLAAGKCLQLASGDTLCDSSGVATFSGAASFAAGCAVGTSVLGCTNITASNSILGNINVCAGPSSNMCLQGNGTGRYQISNSTQHTDLTGASLNDLQLPRIANASLLSCTAGTEDATHSQVGAVALDSTNNGLAFCGGSGPAWHSLFPTTCVFSSSLTCTRTVPSGDNCSCTDATTAVAFKCSVSGTTLTCTQGSSNSDTLNCICF